jgi:transcription initiation factor TFIID TATA-box-binding protein
MQEESHVSIGKRKRDIGDSYSTFGSDDEDDNSFVGFRPAPKEPKLNIDVIDSKKSTTFIENFSKYTERIRVENHVYTTNIGRPINLRAFLDKTETTHGSQYNPKKFAALVIRWRDPRIALLFFSCGKLVCSGAKNKFQARLVIKDALQIVWQLGYTDVKVNKVKGTLQNMVCSVKLKFGIDLDELANERSDICKYRKKIFPGASLKIPKLGSINVSVYSAGRLIITGAKKIADIKKAIKAVIPILIKHKREITMDPIAKINAKSKGDDKFTENSSRNLEIRLRKRKADVMETDQEVVTNEPTEQEEGEEEITTEHILFTEGLLDEVHTIKQSEQHYDEDDEPLFKSSTTISNVPDSLKRFLPMSVN